VRIDSDHVSLMGRPCAGRASSISTTLVAAVASVLVVLLTGCGRSSGTAAAASPRSRSTYTLMQMNLCLSGTAGCYAKVQYPGVLREAEAQIRQAHPDAVTFNEVCGDDVALIARRTGYHVRFSSIVYHGASLQCIRPRGRGLFGDAVLTRAPIEATQSHPFPSQAGPEQRQWLCVRTRVSVDVCTAHLASPEPVEASANAPQCAELRAVLARRARGRPPGRAGGPRRTVIFGGDLNRLSSCAPPGFWTRTDAGPHQDPGSQQVYGTGALRSPSVHVEPAHHTDHDILFVRASLS
jgi:endonuclease/exonuclease/phosphatase family metal-dependent hydrolase